MRLLTRRRDLRDDDEVLDDDVRARHVRDEDIRATPTRDDYIRDDVRDDTIDERRAYPRQEMVQYKWSPANVLVVLAGVALAALGIVALIRTEINETWYTPVETVARINHTPLLGAIEVGVGALLVILGLLGVRMLTAFVCLAGAVAAAVAAMDPTRFETELAIERWWAIALAAGGAALAVLLMLPRPMVTVDRAPRGLRRRRGYGGRVVHQQ
jgi:hypothetical protein